MHRITDVSKKRERELARAKFERQQVRRSIRGQRNLFFKVLAYSIVGLGLVSFLIYQSNKPLDTVASPSESATPTVFTAADPVVAGCTKATEPRVNNLTYPEAPTDTKAAKQINFATNCGDITIKTDNAASNTVSILSSLTAAGYFDGIKCHRLTTDGIYVLQCGDPAGNGTGGPGFKFADENLPKADASGSAIYKRGTVAMANSGANTNGSQFFLVYKDSPLPPNYSIWGTISKGLDQLDAIASAGTTEGTSDGAPKQEVVISKATITP